MAAASFGSALRAAVARQRFAACGLSVNSISPASAMLWAPQGGVPSADFAFDFRIAPFSSQAPAPARKAPETQAEGALSPLEAAVVPPKQLPKDVAKMSDVLAAPPVKAGGKAGERIAKYLSRRGMGSRRQCETIVMGGRVQVDGEAVRSPAFNVPPGATVRVDGVPVARSVPPVKVFLAHKLKGELVSRSDPQGRPSVQARLEAMGVPPGLHPVGRLDFNTEGLLLLTNDGDFSRFLEHPAAGLTRVYRVRVWHGGPEQGGAKRVDKMVKALARGLRVEGVQYAPVSAAVLTHEGAHTWLRMTLAEGKRNEIKNMTRVFGCIVVQLHRLEYGPFALGRLRPGDVLEVAPPTPLLHLAYNFKHNFPAFQAAMGRDRAISASASAKRAGRLPSTRSLRAGAVSKSTATAADAAHGRRPAGTRRRLAGASPAAQPGLVAAKAASAQAGAAGRGGAAR